MPSLTVNPIFHSYQEEANLAFSWDEEGSTPDGLPTHRLRPGYSETVGGVSYGPFAIYGVSYRGGLPAVRTIKTFPLEGPHCSLTQFHFQLDMPAMPVSSAVLHLPFRAGDAGTHDIRVFGVAEPNAMWRQGGDGCIYPVTRRQEESPGYGWGRYRRYRADSTYYQQAHTAAYVDVAWTVTATEDLDVTVTGILNEILVPGGVARTGWKAANTVCLVAKENAPGAIPPYPHDPANPFGGGVPAGWTGSWINFPTNQPTLTVNY